MDRGEAMVTEGVQLNPLRQKIVLYCSYIKSLRYVHIYKLLNPLDTREHFFRSPQGKQELY